jgi:hypothetical protein
LLRADVEEDVLGNVKMGKESRDAEMKNERK